MRVHWTGSDIARKGFQRRLDQRVGVRRDAFRFNHRYSSRRFAFVVTKIYKRRQCIRPGVRRSRRRAATRRVCAREGMEGEMRKRAQTGGANNRGGAQNRP